MARLTLYGMYQYDPTLFDDISLPPDYSKEILQAEILQRSGMLYPYHQVPYILKANMRYWFARNYLNFDRIMEALKSEYNPIENYDLHEDWTRTPNLTDETKRTGYDQTEKDGTDTLQLSGTDTVQLSGTDEVQLSGKDTVQLSGTDEVQLSGKDTVQLSGTDEVQLSGKDTVQLSGKDTLQLSGTDTVTDSGDETTTRTYTNYAETNTRTGNVVNEKTVSAFDASTYQPAEKDTETYNSVQDQKGISGSYADETDFGKQVDTDYGRKDETTYGKKDETTYGRKDETTYGKKDETTYGRKDETTYGKKDETTYGRKDETTYGKKDETTYGRKDETTYDTTDKTTYGSTFTDRHTGTEKFTNYRHGNIGVTSSQDLIMQELEVRKYDVYKDIAERFEREFITQVY